MLIFLGFTIIACMRVIQRLCSKKSSYLINPGISFFRYTAIDQLFAAIFAAIAFIVYGTSGFTISTLLCAFFMALLFALDNYTGIEAVKGASLVICNMYAHGGIIISCVGSWIFFGEKMSVLQIIGLAIFFVSIYFLSPKSNAKQHTINKRTYIMLISSMLVNGAVMLVQKYFSLKVIGGNAAMFSFLTFILSSIIMGICWAITYILNVKKEIVEEVVQVTIMKDNGETEQRPRKTFLGMPVILYLYAGLLAFALFVINLLITEMGKTISSIILFPLSSIISVIMTVLVGRIAFKEKLTLRNIIGLIMGIISIVIISTFTPKMLENLF